MEEEDQGKDLRNDHLQLLRLQHMNSDTRRIVTHPVVMQHNKSTASICVSKMVALSSHNKVDSKKTHPHLEE